MLRRHLEPATATSSSLGKRHGKGVIWSRALDFTSVNGQYRKCQQCRLWPEVCYDLRRAHPNRMQVDDIPQEQLYAALAHEIPPRLEALAQRHSTAEMEAHPAYRTIAPLVARSLATPHIADFRRQEAPLCPRYRLLAWNIERGTQFEAQLEAFRSHPYLKACDIERGTQFEAQ